MQNFYYTKGDRVKDAIENFKQIAFPFTKNGFNHELVKRDGLVCLVRRARIGRPDTPPHYEVVKLRQVPAWVHPATSVQIPPREVYPDYERWGDMGWTYTTIDSALSRFDSLVAAIAPGRVSGRGRYNYTADTTNAVLEAA